jgi:hypothetical protein
MRPPLVRWDGDRSTCFRFSIKQRRKARVFTYELLIRVPFDITRKWEHWGEAGFFTSREAAKQRADEIMSKHLGLPL